MASISALIKISDGFSTPLQNFANRLARAGSAVTGLKGKLGGFGNLKPPTPDFDRFNSTLSQTSGMFSKLVGANVVGGVLTSGIHAATGALGGMLGELNESSTAWQTFTGNMQMVGLNSSQIAAAKNDMQQFAQQTIYSSSDMAQTYAQFAAVGVKDAGKLVKGFGGLAAAATNPQQAMKTLSEQSVQAAAKPKVQWADFRLMMEQTPAGIAQVAKTMGMSMKDLITDVQAGKVKTQDFFNAIAKTGTNAQFTKMATQYKTVGQAMDGLRETLANKMQPAFDKVSKVGIKAISGLVDSIGNVNFNSMANKIAPVAQSIMNTISSVVQYVGGAFQRFWAGVVDSGAVNAVGSAFSSVSSAIGKVFSALGRGGGDPFGMFRNIGSVIGGAVAGAAKLISALAKSLSSLPPGMITALAGAFIALKLGMRGLIFTAIIAGLKGLSKLSPGQLRLLAGAITVLAASFVALKAAQKIKGGLDFLKGLKTPKTPDTPKTPKTPKTPAAPSTPNAPDPSRLSPKWLQLGAALLMVGGAVLMVAAGFYILAQAAINLSNAGGGAIAIFFGFIAAIGILIAVVSLAGGALLAGSVGLLVFGAALLIIGVAVFIAAAGLALLGSQLPNIATYGAMAALNILLLGVAIAAFGILAIVGAVGIIVLSVALIVVAVAMVVAAVGAFLLGAAMLVLGVALLIAAVGVMMIAMFMPIIAATAMTAAIGIMMFAVGAALLGATALLAGVGLMVLAVGLGLASAVMLLATVAAFALGAAAMFLAAGIMAVAVACDMLGAALQTVASGFQSLIGVVAGAVSGMVSAVVSGFTNIRSAVASGIQGAISAVQGMVGGFISAGANLMQGLAQGIMSAGQAAISAAANIANSVASKVKGFFGIHSPSRLFASFGRYLDAGLEIGINSHMNRPVNTAGDLASNVAGAMDPLSKGVDVGVNMPTSLRARAPQPFEASQFSMPQMDMQNSAPVVNVPQAQAPQVTVLPASVQNQAPVINTPQQQVPQVNVPQTQLQVPQAQTPNVIVPQTPVAQSVPAINPRFNVPETQAVVPNNTPAPASDVPTSAPFSNNSNNTTTSVNNTNYNNPNTNHVDRSIHIEQGAIVVNGGATNEETGESIVRKLETFLKNKGNGGEGYGWS